MKMMKLNNGYEIPMLGLGTFLMTDEQAYETITNAIKIGYRLFDTAQMYKNEQGVGKALKESNLKREEYYLVSKLVFHHSIETTKKMIEQSLKDLKTNYIDLFLIHWPNHDSSINIRTWKVLEEYYKKGIFKAIGVSNFTRFQLLELLNEAEIIPAVNQIEMHPGLTQEPVKAFLNEKEIKLMSYGPLMRGGVFLSPYKETLDEVGSKYNLTTAQTVIAWGLNKDIIMIPKTVTTERLKENFMAFDVVMKEEDILKINKLNRGKRVYTDPANTTYGALLED